MKQFRYGLCVVVLLLSIIVTASSCKKNKDAKAIITVLKDSVNLISGDSSQVPVVQASVRFYLDANPNTAHIDTTVFTDTKGKAEFVWFEDAIIQYDVYSGSFVSEENYLILKQGETQEETVNISE
jgi:hypothetical protein